MRQLTNDAAQDRYPRISGSNVVWSRSDGINEEIFFYEGSTGIKRQVTNNGNEKLNFQISGSNLVWQEWDGNDNDFNPQISGSNIIWFGSDGSDNEIFFSPLGGMSVSDSFIFSVSYGVGGMLGNTAFDINVI